MDLKNSIPFKAIQLLDMEHSPEMSHCTIFILYSSQEYIEADIKGWAFIQYYSKSIGKF